MRGLHAKASVTLPPHAAASPPWSGPAQAPDDLGFLYAEPGARPGSLIFWFDRAATRHAFTSFEAHTLGEEVVFLNRRWGVRRLLPPELGARRWPTIPCSSAPGC
jgi:hypothetical protein